MPNDYGYFGQGTTGYAHYTAEANRSGGGGGGGGGNGDNGGCPTGCLIIFATILFLVYLISEVAY